MGRGRNIRTVFSRGLPWKEATLILPAAAVQVQTMCAATLKPHTLRAFEQYVRKTEMGLAARLRVKTFLWV